MAVKKITEKQIADNLKDSAHILVTQPEESDEGTKESLVRIPAAAFEQSGNKNKPNGYAGLDENEKIFPEQLPDGLGSDTFVKKEDLFNTETIVVPAKEASPNLVNPDHYVKGYSVGTNSGKFILNENESYWYIIFPVVAGHEYKAVRNDNMTSYSSLQFRWASGTYPELSDLTQLFYTAVMAAKLNEDENGIATAPEGATWALITSNHSYQYMIYDYTEHGLLTEYEEYRDAIPETTAEVYTIKEGLLPESAKTNWGEEIEIAKSETEENFDVWEDVASEWQVGYMWLADGTYHQITDDETIYLVDAKTNFCATPYDSPIIVNEGEEWHIRINTYIDNKAKAIVIFDENDNLLWSQDNISLPEEGVFITIPEGGAKMYLTYYNNQTYWLKKKVKKSATEMLVDIEEKDKEMLKEALDAHYRTYRRNRPALAENDKAYVIFVIDDCRKDMDIIADAFEAKGIPLCSATIPSNLKNSASKGEETRLQVCQRIVANGGEILAHYGSTLTADNFSFEECYKRFYGNKKRLESYGFDINGIILDGGTGQSTVDFYETEKWASYFYSYSDLYGVAEPYKHQRKALYQKDLNWFTEQVTMAISNKSMVVFFLHDTTEMSLDVLESCLDYLLSLSTDDIKAVTYKTYYDKVLYNG